MGAAPLAGAGGTVGYVRSDDGAWQVAWLTP